MQAPATARAGRPGRGTRRFLLPGLLGLLVAVGVIALLVATGVIWPGRVFAAGHDVRGVDVSSYQGEIDWPVLAGDDLDFAYITATEGSSYVDERFSANWDGALETDLLVGAYHFMSFESPGPSQAQHVIETVPSGATLPVAVDVEFYDEYFQDPPTREQVDAILVPLLEQLTAHYGVPPVIYTTREAYTRYISGA